MKSREMRRELVTKQNILTESVNRKVGICSHLIYEKVHEIINPYEEIEVNALGPVLTKRT